MIPLSLASRGTTARRGLLPKAAARCSLPASSSSSSSSTSSASPSSLLLARDARRRAVFLPPAIARGRQSRYSISKRAAATSAPAAPSSSSVTAAALVIDGRPATADETSPTGQQGVSGLFQAPMTGSPLPLGASLVQRQQKQQEQQQSGGKSKSVVVNFAVFSSAATAMRLCLFSRADLDAGRTTAEVELDPLLNRTGDIWHAMLEVEDRELMYGYRMSGPHQDAEKEKERKEGGEEGGSSKTTSATTAGHRFDESVVLLDPYATSIIGRSRFGKLGPEGLDYGGDSGTLGLSRTWPQAACGLPCDGDAGDRGDGDEAPPFDWEGDRPLGTPMSDLVIYEMHVRGFTADPSSGFRGSDDDDGASSSSSSSTSPTQPLRGTYAALAAKLDYLSSLGVNAIELLPVHEFNELEYYAILPSPGGGGSGEGSAIRLNYWGYSTVCFFAPMARYSSAAAGAAAASAGSSSGRAVIREFKEMVKACHARGIEVILDVVFNHTAEGNEMGPSLSFRGIDNRVYYMLAPEGQYYNYSGCGNTLNCNHPTTRAFVVDCLRYWVEEMHVDGFRFDLASILTRAHSAWHPQEVVHTRRTKGYYDSDDSDGLSSEDDDDIDAYDGMVASFDGDGDGGPEGAYLSDDGYMSDGAGVATGTPLSDPPLVAAIAEDPLLRDTKLIAEAWDCDGLNQVGAFPHYGGRFSEWNGTFRDTVRAFVKGTDSAGTGTSWAANFASALCGSPNVYAAPAGDGDWWGTVGGGARWRGGRGPAASVNFVCAHDGFTLRDLVSYNEKHNHANGEGNNDGEAHNLSWNCGFEGEGVLVSPPPGEQASTSAASASSSRSVSSSAAAGVTTRVGSASELASVSRLRARQARNLAAALLLSHGVPMLHMGDEYAHSKRGNNNTYCHDSPLNWFDWRAAARDEWGLLRFQRALLALRKARPELRRTEGTFVSDGEVEWHGTSPGEPDWSDASRLVALTLRGGGVGGEDAGGGGLYIAFSTAHVPVTLLLPRWHGRAWRPLIDTAKPAPLDVLVEEEQGEEAEEEGSSSSATRALVLSALSAASAWTAEGLYPLLPWSMVVLESVPEDLVTRAAASGAATCSSSSSSPVEELLKATSVRLPRLRGVSTAAAAGTTTTSAPSTPSPSPPSSPAASSSAAATERKAIADKMRAEIEEAAAENERLRAALAQAAAEKKARESSSS